MKLFFLVRAFLSTKLSKKPGDGGFMVNVPTTAMKSGWDGKIYFHKIVLKSVAKSLWKIWHTAISDPKCTAISMPILCFSM